VPSEEEEEEEISLLLGEVLTRRKVSLRGFSRETWLLQAMVAMSVAVG
jgi:hypothetical protein